MTIVKIWWWAKTKRDTEFLETWNFSWLNPAKCATHTHACVYYVRAVTGKGLSIVRNLAVRPWTLFPIRNSCKSSLRDQSGFHVMDTNNWKASFLINSQVNKDNSQPTTQSTCPLGVRQGERDWLRFDKTILSKKIMLIIPTTEDGSNLWVLRQSTAITCIL